MAINKDNNLQISGNIANVPDTGSFTGKEGPVPYWNSAIAYNHKSKGVMFFDVIAYGSTATNLSTNTSKGDAVIIWGELQKEEWKKKTPEDKPKYNHKIVISEYKNLTSIYGKKDKPFSQQEMHSGNAPLADTPF